MTAPGRQSVHPAGFRQAMRRLAGGVAVLSLCGDDGMPLGMAATSVVSLSLDPPSLLFCVNLGATIAPLVTPGRAVAVNILAGAQADVAHVFGGMTAAKGTHRFASGNWTRGEDGAPVLQDARCVVECRVDETLDRFTHRIVIALARHVRLPGRAESGLVSDNGRLLPLSLPDTPF